MEKEEVMWTRSNGEQVPIKQMNTEHILNSLSKEFREAFNCKTKKETAEKIKKIDMLKNEYYRRFNDFNEKLEEE